MLSGSRLRSGTFGCPFVIPPSQLRAQSNSHISLCLLLRLCISCQKPLTSFILHPFSSRCKDTSTQAPHCKHSSQPLHSHNPHTDIRVIISCFHEKLPRTRSVTTLVGPLRPPVGYVSHIWGISSKKEASSGQLLERRLSKQQQQSQSFVSSYSIIQFVVILNKPLQGAPLHEGHFS